MPLHFLFPAHPIRPALIDEIFADQFQAVTGKGFSASTCSESVLQNGRPLRGVPADSSVCYRGWMMNAGEYGKLADAVVAAGATMLTPLQSYLTTHHLPN